ncbi:MAG: hypothetical protein J1E33_05180 [Alistipes sp.]|nr:hypothetical protein [Alistipes sp.]
MKKLVIALTSVFAVGIIANSYAVNQYPEVNMDNSCREQGVTYRTSQGSTDSQYKTTVSVPEKNSPNINVQVTERSGQTRGYDTRSNNVGSAKMQNKGNTYNNYEYNSGADAKVNINCY